MMVFRSRMLSHYEFCQEPNIVGFFEGEFDG